jgi:hypothetical protein
MRASLLRGITIAAEARDGEGGWARLVESLPEDSRQIFQQALDSYRWIETTHVNAMAQAYEARFGRETVPDRAMIAVQEQLKVSHPGVLELLDPLGFIQQAPALFGIYYKGGRLDVDEVVPGRALISIFAAGLFPSWYTHSCPTWICGALGLAGAARAEFRHHPPAEGFRHRYELRWGER